MPFRALLDLLFPPLCHICKAFIPEAGDLFICASCLEKITFLVTPLCSVCGTPFGTENGLNHICGACLRNPSFPICRSATYFAGPVQELIHRFKYGHRVHLSQPLGLLTARALAPFRAESAPELVVPVPLHRRRLRQRGYNQSQLLAEVLAKQWKLKLEVGNLRRIRWTEPQTSLDATDRRDNVRGAFAVRDPRRLEGRRVLLVDDVFTTGSTIRACAGSLRDAGVAEVFVVTVARSVQQSI
jgi:ComF family protein